MKQIKVLIIDQDEANRNFLAQMILKKNYLVEQAGTGQAGLQLASQAMPDLVIFDPNLTDIPARDLIAGFRQNQHIAGIPLVALSSHSDPEEMQACLQAGCAEYYVKSGMVMINLVEAIPRLLVENQKVSTEKRKGLTFVFLSAKGGVGTSSLCANIGVNIAQNMSPSTVSVVDMVLPFGSIAPIVGVKENDFSLISVSEMAEKEITPDYLRANLAQPPHWLFHILPGSPDPEHANRLQVQRIPKIIESMRASFDYILIDIGRALSKISLPIIQEADQVVLVLSTDLSSIGLTKKLWEYLSNQGIKKEKMFAILNRAVGLEGLSKMEAEKILGIDIKLTMPYLMGNFALANNQNIPFNQKFPNDTGSMVLKQASIEMSQQAIKTRTD